jgi:hypothetical protein
VVIVGVEVEVIVTGGGMRRNDESRRGVKIKLHNYAAKRANVCY